MQNFKYIFLLGFLFVGCFQNPPLPNEELVKTKSFSCIVYCDMAKKYGCGEGESIIYPQTYKINKDCAKGICISWQCTDTCLNICNTDAINDVPLMLECLMPLDKCDFEYKEFCRT
jgi:hypothetical protein